MYKIYFFIICLHFIPSANADETKHVSVGWELWYPYQYHNRNDELTGMDIEIFNAISKQANLEHSFLEIPWKRHLRYIKNGVIHVALGASPSTKRKQYAYFTKPYRQETIKLFIKKGNPKQIELLQLSDLINSDYLIGVENGYYYGETFSKLIENPQFKIKINRVIDLEQNARMLLNGRIDGFLVDPLTMKFFIEKFKLQGEFEQHPLAIHQSDVHIMLSKKLHTKKELQVINEAITALEKNGKLAVLKRKWSKIPKNTN